MLDNYPADLQEFVRQKIAAGTFQTVDEFAVEAATLYQELDRRHQILRQQVLEGLTQLDVGNCAELENDDSLAEFFERIKQQGRNDLKNASTN